MNVMAPTMQVACKVFIVPNPAAWSPKERYTHVPRSLRRVRHARCFNGECPSEATDKIGMRHIYWSAVAEMRHPYHRFTFAPAMETAGVLSALPLKADIASAPRNVCLVPKADIGWSIQSPRRRGQ